MASVLGLAVIPSGNRTPSGSVANFSAASLLTMISWPAQISVRDPMIQATITVKMKNFRIPCSFLPRRGLGWTRREIASDATRRPLFEQSSRGLDERTVTTQPEMTPDNGSWFISITVCRQEPLDLNKSSDAIWPTALGRRRFFLK